jgi:hypothetical protein
MQQHLSPAGWKRRAQARVARVGYRWEDCSIPHGVLRMGKRSKSASVGYLHAAHVNHDSHNPQAELRALCPCRQLKYDRRTERKRAGARRQGYQVVSTTRWLMEMQGAGLRITQEGDRFAWQVDDRFGLADGLLDAIGSAPQCLVRDRVQEVHACVSRRLFHGRPSLKLRTRSLGPRPAIWNRCST